VLQPAPRRAAGHEGDEPGFHWFSGFVERFLANTTLSRFAFAMFTVVCLVNLAATLSVASGNSTATACQSGDKAIAAKLNRAALNHRQWPEYR
jgi:hypothetical protein